jgi:hypothetical protein
MILEGDIDLRMKTGVNGRVRERKREREYQIGGAKHLN